MYREGGDDDRFITKEKSVLGEIPRLMLRPEDAATAVGVERSYFDREIGPNVRRIKRGRMILYSVQALEEWYDRNAGLGQGI